MIRPLSTGTCHAEQRISLQGDVSGITHTSNGQIARLQKLWPEADAVPDRNPSRHAIAGSQSPLTLLQLPAFSIRIARIRGGIGAQFVTILDDRPITPLPNARKPVGILDFTGMITIRIYSVIIGVERPLRIWLPTSNRCTPVWLRIVDPAHAAIESVSVTVVPERMIANPISIDESLVVSVIHEHE